MITNPLTYVGWARWAGLDRPFARRAYAALVVSLILLTATLMTFIVTQGGAPNGSYGYGYWAQKELGKSNEGRGF
jgi:hypothetical protein